MDWAQLLVPLVALYGAVLSTYNLIVKLLDRRVKLIILLSQGFFAEEEISWKLFVTVANPSNKSITINPPSIKLPRNQQLVFPSPLSDVRFPHELQPEKDCRIWMDTSELVNHLRELGCSGAVKIRAEVTDRVGRRYKSKKFKFDMSTWNKKEE